MKIGIRFVARRQGGKVHRKGLRLLSVGLSRHNKPKADGLTRLIYNSKALLGAAAWERYPSFSVVFNLSVRF
jgi:hypothetical protein